MNVFDEFGDALPSEGEGFAVVDEDAQVEGYIGTPGEAVAPVRAAGAERSAEERIGELMEQMRAQRKVLTGVLELCAEPASGERVAARVADLSVGNYSVYSAANYCALLERAGALVQVDAAGQPFDPASAEPQVEEVGGVRCLRPAAGHEVFWLATAAGLEAVAENRPASRLEALFEERAAYLPVFKRVLEMCAREGGAATGEINAAVDGDPLVQEPRYFASFFTERLESCEALAWDGAWHTTEVGLEGLAMLADVDSAA